MAGSFGTYSGGGIPGLTLRAWALLQGSSGALIKGFNVASVTRASAGNYTLNLSAAMPDTNALLDLKTGANGLGASYTSASNGVSASAVTYRTILGSADTDTGIHWIGVYG